MYLFHSKVRYSEINHRGTLSLPALINYFQDCSTFHSEEAGYGMQSLKEHKRAWILSYWQIEVDRLPRLAEDITVGTFATEFKGLLGSRNYWLEDKDKNRLACANSVWVFMDMEKGRPTKPFADEISKYGTHEPLDMHYEGRKIKRPEAGKEYEPFPVLKANIDTNEHVNNCQYVQMALELLPDDMEVHSLRVEYCSSAVYGDIIYPVISEEDTRTVVQLMNEQKKPYAIVELRP